MVYFLRCEKTTTTARAGWIKIGTTKRLTPRRSRIGVEAQSPVTVLAVIDGSYAEEKALYRRFSHLRVSGEWFLPDPTLLGMIQREGRPWRREDDQEIPGTIIRIDKDLIKKAKIVAAMRKIKLKEYIDSVLWPIVDRDITREAKRLMKEFAKAKRRNGDD